MGPYLIWVSSFMLSDEFWFGWRTGGVESVRARGGIKSSWDLFSGTIFNRLYDSCRFLRPESISSSGGVEGLRGEHCLV